MTTDQESNYNERMLEVHAKPEFGRKAFEFLLITTIGLIVAAVLLATDYQSSRWGIFFVFVLTAFFVSLFVRKPRKYILTLSILSIQFQASKTFGRMGHFGGSGGLEIQLSDVGLALLLILWMYDLSLHKRKIDFFPYTTIPAILFIFAGGLSIANSSYPQLSVFELIRIGKYFLLYLCMANILHPKEDLPWCVTAFVASILIQGLIALAQVLHGGPLGLGILGEPEAHIGVQVLNIDVQRALGTLAGPNAYGMYMGATIPIAFAMLFAEIKLLKKLFYMAALTAGIVGLVLSLCRSQWVILPLVTILAFMLSMRRRTSQRGARFAAGIFFVIVAIVITSASGLIRARLTADYGAAFSRMSLARAAIRAVRAHPIVGMGINTYSLNIRKYDPTSDHAVSIAHPPEAARRMHISHPVHNIFLLYAAEIGLIGVIFFLWLIYRTYKSLFYTLHNSDQFSNTVAIGILASFSSLLLHSLLDWALIRNSLFTLFWVLIAITAALYKSSHEMSKTFKE